MSIIARCESDRQNRVREIGEAARYMAAFGVLLFAPGWMIGAITWSWGDEFLCGLQNTLPSWCTLHSWQQLDQAVRVRVWIIGAAGYSLGVGLVMGFLTWARRRCQAECEDDNEQCNDVT
jgi:hypothetical protein